MPLEYPAHWKFEGIGLEVPNEVFQEFSDLIRKIAAGTPKRKWVFETFKSAFGVNSYSSDESWAETDLFDAMRRSKKNVALFVASFWHGIEEIENEGITVPSPAYLNTILIKYDVPLIIDPPELKLKSGDIVLGAPAEDVDTPLHGSYTRGEQLGKGGFGVVYRVTRTTTVGEFDFAMKVLDPSPFIENKERALARFKREIQVLSKLQHRGIVQHIEAGIDGDQKPYILMPLIDGVNLQDALSGVGPPQVYRAFDEILSAIDYAHGQQVLHRDLKPSNILVRSSDDQPIIVDFGCAYLMENATETSLTSCLIGSTAYMPEEVLRNPKLRTTGQDIFACGIILYQVIMGKLPNRDDYESVEEVFDDFGGIDQVIQEAIAPARERIKSAAIFRKRLARLAKQS